MKHVFAVVALLGLALTGCGGDAPAPTADTTLAAPPAPAAPEANAKASAATPEALERAAKANQETTADAETDKGDARLERVAALPASAQLPAGKWKAGTNYVPLSPAQPTSAEPGQVEVMEVFWYGCPHCFALEPEVTKWLKTKPSYVKFVRAPVTWGAVHRAHARLFYTLEALGKLDELHAKAFAEIHERNNLLVSNDDAQTLKIQAAFAKANGVSEDDYVKAFNSFGVNSSMQHAEDLTRRFQVEGVPAFYINGKYQTDISSAGSPAKLFELIDDLAAAEKRR